MNENALVSAVAEVEAHVAEEGWDSPPRLFALVPTDQLIGKEPQLAAQLGVDQISAAGTLTPVEQEGIAADVSLERLLTTIIWPADVVGCAAVVERLTLPPEAEQDVPDDPEEAHAFAAQHPLRQEVRIAAGVTRDGERHCVIRVRGREELVQGPDLVPAVTRLLLHTLND